MTWVQLLVGGFSVVRELLKYLNQKKKCSRKEQVEELKKLKDQIKKAGEKADDPENITIFTV